MTDLTKRIAVAAMALACVVACGSPDGGGACARNAMLVEARGDLTPELRVCPLREQYVLGEPIELLLVVRGSQSPLPFYNHPDYYEFEVIGEGGDTLRAKSEFHAILHYEDRAALTIPARGAVSFLIDLNCMRPILVALDTLFPSCWERIPFEKGKYTLTVRWRDARASRTRDQSRPTVTEIAASPVTIHIRE